jgi:hypothetical protein
MPAKVGPVQPRAALRAVEARKPQRGRAASAAGLKKARACRSPTPPACAPQGLSRPEGRHSRRSSAIGLIKSRGVPHMTTIRTRLNLRKSEARRLMARGYEILHIETRHLEDRDESDIVWTRPTRPDDIPEHELPY